MDQKKNDIEQLKFYEKLCFASKTEEDEDEWLAVEIAYLQHHVCKMNDRIVCQLFSLHDLSVSLRKQYYTPGKWFKQ